VGKVIAQAMMSLDGFIAKDDNTIGRLFDWLQNGDVEVVTPRGDRTFRLSPQSAEHWRRWASSFAVLVCGRTLFDLTDGWDGRHDFDVPVVVVTHTEPVEWIETHPEAPFHFVTDGVEAAIAQAQQLAGDRAVNVAAGVVAGQCLELGLLDEVAIDLVPVVMGGGRPFFGHLSADVFAFGQPDDLHPRRPGDPPRRPSEPLTAHGHGRTGHQHRGQSHRRHAAHPVTAPCNTEARCPLPPARSRSRPVR
jgi:dihydrofolate reductase